MPDLAIDSASDEAAVAVLDGDRVLVERRWSVATNYSLELLAGIDAALKEAGLAPEALTSIAVDIGPGGYSGLRTGVATAQGLALGLGIPLAGVSRLELAAFPHLDGGDHREATDARLPVVVAVHDPGRGSIGWAAYEARPGGAPATIVAPRLDTPEGCAGLAPASARWCGELSEALWDALRAAGRDSDHAPAAAANHRRAADLVRLARLHGAYRDEPEAVDVFYLRPPNITRPREPRGSQSRPTR